MNPSFFSTLFQLTSKNRMFFIPFTIVAISWALLIIFVGNRELFLFFNQYHGQVLDYLFVGFTYMGDGVAAFLVIFMLLWRSFRDSISLLIITLLITLIVYIIKSQFFPGLDRPSKIFQEGIRLVTFYQPPMHRTFPSGHTATAFSIYLYLAFVSQKKHIKFSLFALAGLVGYSRVYLSAHFPADILAGAILAILITSIFYNYAQRWSKPWLNRSFSSINFRLTKNIES